MRMIIDDEFVPPEFAQEAMGSAERPRQQLVARIKRSSKYYGQTAAGEWFEVRVVNDRLMPLRGNSNNYRMSDVAFGVRLEDGTVVELK